MSADVRLAESWLRQHGLGDGPPTPLLTERLAVRRRARLLGSVLPALLILGAAWIQVAELGGLLLSLLIVALLLARTLLDAWIRRVDRRAGAALARRVAHPAPPGLMALLGLPYVVMATCTFAGAFALAVSGLVVSTERNAAVGLLVAVAGVAAGTALQLRELMVRPVVAEDEVSLTADVIMRIEDARESTMPGILWSLPMVLVFGFAPVWWMAAAFAFVVLGLAAYAAVQFRTPRVAAMARHVVRVR